MNKIWGRIFRSTCIDKDQLSFVDEVFNSIALTHVCKQILINKGFPRVIYILLVIEHYNLIMKWKINGRDCKIIHQINSTTYHKNKFTEKNSNQLSNLQRCISRMIQLHEKNFQSLSSHTSRLMQLYLSIVLYACIYINFDILHKKVI